MAEITAEDVLPLVRKLPPHERKLFARAMVQECPYLFENNETRLTKFLAWAGMTKDDLVQSETDSHEQEKGQ